MQSVLLDIAGHRRSPATMPGYHRARSPRNKGEHYPADPPTVEEIVLVMRTVGDRADGHRLRALIVLLWRAVRQSRDIVKHRGRGGMSTTYVEIPARNHFTVIDELTAPNGVLLRHVLLLTRQIHGC